MKLLAVQRRKTVTVHLLRESDKGWQTCFAQRTESPNKGRWSPPLSNFDSQEHMTFMETGFRAVQIQTGFQVAPERLQPCWEERPRAGQPIPRRDFFVVMTQLLSTSPL